MSLSYPLSLIRRYRLTGVWTLMRYVTARVVGNASGPGRSCPVCNWTGREFHPVMVLPQGFVRPRAMCPRCGCLERHRSFAPVYRRLLATEYADRQPRVLHFTPEQGIADLFRAHASSYQQSVYEHPAPGQIQLDLCNLDLPDASYDILLINGILRDVGDLPAAVRHTYRVLRPGGVLLAGELVMLGQRTRELERPDVHWSVRDFGELDLAERFAPFDMELISAAEELTPDERQRYNVPLSNWRLLVLRKR